MYIKLDYFYFSSFDPEVKAAEILKYILPFSDTKMVRIEGGITKF